MILETKTIYIETDEDIASIIERLQKTKATDITLVIPKAANILQDTLNLEIIRREGARLTKKVSIISSGLNSDSYQPPRVYDIQKLVRGPRPSPQPEKFIKPRLTDYPSPRLERPVSAKTRHGFRAKMNTRYFLIFALFSLLVVCAVVIFVLPTANIYLKAKTQPLTADLEIIVDQNIRQSDINARKIPGQMITVEEQSSQEFTATGFKYLSEKARGKVIIYNEWGTEVWQEETRLQDTEGRTFFTVQSYRIPGPIVEEGEIVVGTREIEVVAEKPGEEFNIGPTEFRIPAFKERGQISKFEKIFGRSKEAMKGGVNKKITFVTEDDLAKAEDILSKEVLEKIKGKLTFDSSIPLKLLDRAIESQRPEIISNARVNDEVQNFQMKAKASQRALIFNEEKLFALVNDILLTQVPTNKDLLKDKAEIAYEDIGLNLDQGQMILKIRTVQTVIWRLDLEKIKKDLVGKDRKQIENYLDYFEGVNLVKIKFWPFGIGKIPFLVRRINFILDID